MKFANQPYIPDYDMKVAYDASGRQEYIGFAIPGQKTLAADNAWQIYKLVYDGSGRVTTRRYADGSDDFIKVWDDKTTYTYLV